jgi:hypothetical protein
MIDTMGQTPPEGAVLLFADGSDGPNAFTTRDGSPARWPVLDDGSLLARGGDIVSRERFVDFYLHLEFWCCDSPPDVKGQGRANSGVFLQGRYELQVLDSWGIDREPGKGDCGALYNHAAPLVNASRRPEEWQTYDVFFRAPRFDEEGRNKVENARVTALQNGLVIHNNVEVPQQTGAAFDENYDQAGPLLLQDHGNDVRYRNVWVVPLRNKGADYY